MEPVPDTFTDLFIGYTAIWAILAVYVYVLIQKMNKLSKRSSSSKE